MASAARLTFESSVRSEGFPHPTVAFGRLSCKPPLVKHFPLPATGQELGVSLGDRKRERRHTFRRLECASGQARMAASTVVIRLAHVAPSLACIDIPW